MKQQKTSFEEIIALIREDTQAIHKWYKKHRNIPYDLRHRGDPTQ